MLATPNVIPLLSLNPRLPALLGISRLSCELFIVHDPPVKPVLINPTNCVCADCVVKNGG